MTEDDVTKDDVTKDDSVQPGGGEPTDVDAEQASAGEGLLSLDDLLSGAQGTSCSIDGTCD